MVLLWVVARFIFPSTHREHFRLYDLQGTLYLCYKDLTPPNPINDSNLAGYRILSTLATS